MIAACPAQKKVTNVGTTSAPFLEIGVGARAIGMGGAFVATANDITAMYWNPAGLGDLHTFQTIYIHTNWLADISFDYAGLIIPLQNIGTLGLNITMLNMGDMDVRTVDYPDGTGERFSATDMAIGVSYGFNLTNRFAFGFNLKYIHQQIWKEQARGFAIDIGTMYDTPFEGLRLGAALTNFGTDMRMTGNDLLVYYDSDAYNSGNNDKIITELKTDSWPLPLNFQLGAALDFLSTETHLFTFEADAVHPLGNSESMHLGLEYGFKKQIFLRAGYRNLFLQDSEENFTFGGGIDLNIIENMRFGLDYAFADFGRLENAQRFAIILKF